MNPREPECPNAYILVSSSEAWLFTPVINVNISSSFLFYHSYLSLFEIYRVVNNNLLMVTCIVFYYTIVYETHVLTLVKSELFLSSYNPTPYFARENASLKLRDEKILDLEEQVLKKTFRWMVMLVSNSKNYLFFKPLKCCIYNSLFGFDVGLLRLGTSVCILKPRKRLMT